MPTIPEILLKEALDLANEVITHTDKDDPSLTDIQNRKSQIETALQNLKVSVNQLSGFQPIIRGELQCPFCYVRSGIHVRLTPRSSDDDEDISVCSGCEYEVRTPTD